MKNINARIEELESLLSHILTSHEEIGNRLSALKAQKSNELFRQGVLKK